MTTLKSIVIILLAIYLIVGLSIYFLQEKMIFLPEDLEQNHQYDFDADFEEQFIEMEDGARINALYFKLPDPKGLILYMHGNAGNLDRWGHVVVPFTVLGYEVYVIDYRGYGKSTGEKSKKLMLKDVRKVYDHVLQYTDEEKLTVYGRSLGTSFASYLAGLNKPSRVILEAPFYSIADMAKRRFPIFPHNLLLRYDLNNHKSLKTASCPIYIFHGTADDLVPFDSGKKLADSLSSEKQVLLYPIEKGGHNDLINFDIYHEKLMEILR